MNERIELNAFYEQIVERYKEICAIRKTVGHLTYDSVTPEYVSIEVNHISILEECWDTDDSDELDIKYFEEDGLELYKQWLIKDKREYALRDAKRKEVKDRALYNRLKEQFKEEE